MFGDPRVLIDDSMPTKKRRMEYHIQLPELSAGHSAALAAGPSRAAIGASNQNSALAAGPSRAAIGASNQNAALPAPKSMAAITGPTQLALTAPLRGRDRRIRRQLAIEMTPEYQVALRELQELVPRRGLRRPRRGRAIPLEDFEPKRQRL
jgi:hypothetical protein